MNVLRLLHGVLKPNSYGKTNKRKFIIVDSQDAFNTNVKNITEFETDFQKISIVIEEDGDSKAFYVCFGLNQIKLTTYIDSIILSFKLFKCTYFCYPLQCVNIWQFIEKFLFEIDVVNESTFVKTFVNDLKTI